MTQCEHLKSVDKSLGRSIMLDFSPHFNISENKDTFIFLKKYVFIGVREEGRKRNTDVREC